MVDIETLEADLAELQTQQQQLQVSYTQTLTEQQQAQQQVWAKRLAQALATHLQARLEASLITPGGSGTLDAVASFSEATQRLAALDATLHSTLQSLQQDLNSYQSSLSQQVSRMQSMEQQGEAILEALVIRLSQQLQRQMVQPGPRPDSANGHHGVQLPSQSWTAGQTSAGLPSPPVSPAVSPLKSGASPSQPSTAHFPAQPPLVNGMDGSTAPLVAGTAVSPAMASNSPAKNGGNLRAGLLLVLLSTLALSLHNVLVGLIGYGGQVFGRFPVESIFPLTIPNSLMLLWLRMVVVVPLMALIATRLRPTVGEEISQLLNHRDKRPLMHVIASGSFLFLSQVLIYKAISDVGPGVAVTLLFMYPLITVPLAWFLFGDRPTPLRLVVMFAISMGIVFTALPRIYSDIGGSGVSPWGIGAATLSSIAFALYLVAMQISFRRLHPVPVSLMQFSTVFTLTSLILIVGSFFGLQPGEPSSQLGLYVGGLMLGFLTLLGYLFNNYGVKLMGAAQASIVAASGPVMTAILAYLITPGEKSALHFIQWMGVVLVTLGVISLSLERLARLKRGHRTNQVQA
jgi:drug/metabolite transporter (DMT)-like permease